MKLRGTGISRGNPPGTAAGVIGSTVIHAAAASLLFATVRPPPKPSPPAVAVNLVAAPAPAPKQRIAREALPTPPVEKPAPVKPPPKAKTKPVPKEPAPKPRPAEPERREPPPPTQAPVTPVAGETPSTGTDVATIKTPGQAFPFPEYLKNIVNQVYVRWDRPTAGRLSAEVGFSILRDGTVREIRITTPSGSFNFDLNARGAVEAAGNARAFGPLPAGWPADVLTISIVFKPIR